MYVLNEYMEFGVDTPHIATYNFKLVFHLLFSTIYSNPLAGRESWFTFIGSIKIRGQQTPRHWHGHVSSIITINGRRTFFGKLSPA